MIALDELMKNRSGRVLKAVVDSWIAEGVSAETSSSSDSAPLSVGGGKRPLVLPKTKTFLSAVLDKIVKFADVVLDPEALSSGSLFSTTIQALVRDNQALFWPKFLRTTSRLAVANLARPPLGLDLAAALPGGDKPFWLCKSTVSLDSFAQAGVDVGVGDPSIWDVALSQKDGGLLYSASDVLVSSFSRSHYKCSHPEDLLLRILRADTVSRYAAEILSQKLAKHFEKHLTTEYVQLALRRKLRKCAVYLGFLGTHTPRMPIARFVVTEFRCYFFTLTL